MSETPGPAGPQRYSLAFEKFVDSRDGENDVVGLLAYALFKQSVRETARAGTAAPGDRRDPSPTTVDAYRGAASQLLTGVIDRAIEEATPEIQQSATLAAISTAGSEIKSHVTQRTSFGSALLTNIIAWLVTLAIAALVVITYSRDGVEETIAGGVDRIEGRR